MSMEDVLKNIQYAFTRSSKLQLNKKSKTDMRKKSYKTIVTQVINIDREYTIKNNECPLDVSMKDYCKKCDELIEAKKLLENLLEVGALGDGDAAAIRTMLGFVCEVMDSEHDWIQE